jgi:hypothetical protein
VVAIALSAAIAFAPLASRAQMQSPEVPSTAPAKPPQPPRIPDIFTNLQVLPKDITKPELMKIMKGFAVTMEKRCSFCHVATDDLSQADFASDDKETKKKTRELLQAILATQKSAAKAP